MATTIQIDEKTKDDLFLIKNELERELGKSITYNEVLKILLDKYRQEKKKTKSWEEFKKLKGIIPPDSMEILKNERKIDEKWAK